MNQWYATTAVLLANIALVAVRAPHGQRSRGIAVVKSRKGRREIVLLTLAWIAFFLPLLWVFSPVFAFADYHLRTIPYAAGIICYAFGLWLFHRSHADLGTNWSISLELRENHSLVTRGVYGWVRHPMYLALFVYSAGQALVLPNYLAGPWYSSSGADSGLKNGCCAKNLGPHTRRMRSEPSDCYRVSGNRPGGPSFTQAIDQHPPAAAG